MGIFDDLKNKAQELVRGHEGAIAGGVKNVGDFVDERTGGKFAEQIEGVQNAASDLLNHRQDTEAPVVDEVPVDVAPVVDEVPVDVAPVADQSAAQL